MNKTTKINVWGRSFELKIFFDVYENENILDNQKEALYSFVNNADHILGAYRELEVYCLEKDGDLIGNSISNIFKYVMPTSLFIIRDEKIHKVALLCNYRFDEEHGIALFFENEKLIKIGTQDDI